MSDVSIENFTLLTDKIDPDPYYLIATKAHDLIIEKFGYKIRGNASEITMALESGGVLKDIYAYVGENYGYSRLNSFTENVRRRLNCFIAVDSNRNIVGWTKKHWPCKIKGCQRCGPYRASRYLKYPHEIVLVGESDDIEESVSTVEDINKVCKAMDYGYMVATTIPTHDGRNIISIACLRYQETNPLTPDNEVKEAVEFVEREYPFLERAIRIKTENEYESMYVTEKSDITFTTTQLYETMPEGQDTIREKGRMSGFYWDYDKMELAYLSKKDRQKKIDEEEGVVLKFDAPAPRSDVPDTAKKNAIRSTVRITSSHRDRAAFSAETNEDVAYHVKRFNAVYIEQLENSGYPQAEVQVSVRLTQKDIDEFNSLVGIPKNGGFGDNILNIEFEDLDRKTYGIRDRVHLIRQRLLFETQQKLKDNLTVDELSKKIFNQIRSKPPS